MRNGRYRGRSNAEYGQRVAGVRPYSIYGKLRTVCEGVSSIEKHIVQREIDIRGAHRATQRAERVVAAA